VAVMACVQLIGSPAWKCAPKMMASLAHGKSHTGIWFEATGWDSSRAMENVD
jgi:hypothetical protein